MFLKHLLTVHKTSRRFSAMSVDQAHEQQYNVVKVMVVLCRMADDEHAL